MTQPAIDSRGDHANESAVRWDLYRFGRRVQYEGAWVIASVYQLRPDDDPSDRDGSRVAAAPGALHEHEDLAYKVELWDRAGTVLEAVLAVTSSASIGYAAFYAATREHPDAVITLRHKNRTMSRWGGKPH